MRSPVRLQFLIYLETTLVGLFFIQGLRFLVGILYSRVAGASVVAATPPADLPPLPGVIDPSLVTGEITFAIWVCGLPLLALVFGGFRPLMVVAAGLIATGRLFINTSTVLTPTASAALVVGAGLLYIALLVRHRAQMLPYLFVVGLAVDQLFRAVGNTYDPSWSVAYLLVQAVLSILLILISVMTVIGQARRTQQEGPAVTLDNGLLPFWGGVGMGALLFLELSLLALPNAIAGRARVDYTTFVPLVLVATALPLVPWVRGRAREFINLFDGSVRGWAWLLLLAICIVLGTRIPGIIGGIALVVAQFAVSLLWWWLVRPRAERERSFTGLWLLGAVFLFGLLAASDFFTYEYAFVRDFTGDLEFLNTVIPPLLRGFRGMGLGVLLLAAFFAVIPMTQTLRRIPWTERRASRGQSLVALVLTAAMSIGAAVAAQPPLVEAVRTVDSFRVGTYNIHSGFNEFFHYDLEAVARTIRQSGASVVMLQEVEAGRMTSFGVDQTLWLARRLGMDRRFYPTNEGLQGLAVLSSVPIVFDEGVPLTSIGNQTGLQRVQVSTDGTSAVTFYNTWLGLLLDLSGSRTIAEQEQDQQRQLTEIFTKIAADHPGGILGRTVLGGTFNNTPDSPLVQQVRAAGFNDPFAGLPIELSATLWRTNLQARLDYLFTRNVQPVGAVVMDTAASDHRMAVAEIIITRSAQ